MIKYIISLGFGFKLLTILSMALPVVFSSLHEANSSASRLITLYKNNIISEQEYKIACVEIMQKYMAFKMASLKQKIKPFTQAKSRLSLMSK